MLLILRRVQTQKCIYRPQDRAGTDVQAHRNATEAPSLTHTHTLEQISRAAPCAPSAARSAGQPGTAATRLPPWTSRPIRTQDKRRHQRRGVWCVLLKAAKRPRRNPATPRRRAPAQLSSRRGLDRPYIKLQRLDATVDYRVEGATMDRSSKCFPRSSLHPPWPGRHHGSRQATARASILR